MLEIGIVADIILLIALTVSAGCSAWVEGYVKQKNLEVIIPAAMFASNLQFLLCIMIIAKIAVASIKGP